MGSLRTPKLGTPALSVVIRSKNEARWMEPCLRALASQRLQAVECIVVDNDSTDGSWQIAERLGAKLVRIPEGEFSYGRAINVGFEVATAPLVAILSAHCIPVNDLWADYLVAALTQAPNIAGVYGRQEPLPDTPDFDKRDLWLTFRDDRVYQRRDVFFHNANSAIPLEVWKQHPFDEAIAGQEDREWGQRMIGLGYSLVYEPHARVYHQHGIHQGRNEARAARVVRVIEHLNRRKRG